MHRDRKGLDCAAAAALVRAALDGELEDPERELFEQHLEECATCREEVAGLQSSMGVLRAYEPEPLPATFLGAVRAEAQRAVHPGARRRRPWLPWALAAAASAAALLGWLRAPRVVTIERISARALPRTSQGAVERPAPPRITAPRPIQRSVHLLIDTAPLASVLHSWRGLLEVQLRQVSEQRARRLEKLERERLELLAHLGSSTVKSMGTFITALAGRVEAAWDSARAESASPWKRRETTHDRRTAPVPAPSRLASAPRPGQRPPFLAAPAVTLMRTSRGLHLRTSGSSPEVLATLRSLVHDDRPEVAALARAYLRRSSNPAPTPIYGRR